VDPPFDGEADVEESSHGSYFISSFRYDGVNARGLLVDEAFPEAGVGLRKWGTGRRNRDAILRLHARR